MSKKIVVLFFTFFVLSISLNLNIFLEIVMIGESSVNARNPSPENFKHTNDHVPAEAWHPWGKSYCDVANLVNCEVNRLDTRLLDMKVNGKETLITEFDLFNTMSEMK